MLLSIGMIVKNEEANLRDCLNGIKPILEQVDSELIIADTGSSDGTVEIAKEFTDNVYAIEWRGDFAWARNTTLERASGKWFMFLDADEFFQDVSEIIEFFNSGEYKKYVCATHLRYETGVKNFTEVMRLYKKEKGMAFIGKIHEHIPLRNPFKKLGSFSAHTGYAFGGEGGKAKEEAKKKRNMAPLMELHKENPENLRIINQIVGSTLGDRASDTADEFLAMGLALRGKDTEDIFYHALRRYKIMRLMGAGKTREAIDETEDYFKTSKKLYSFSVMLRFLEAMMFEKEGMREESLGAFKSAVGLYEDYLAGRLDNKDEVFTITPKVREGFDIVNARGAVMQCAWLGSADHRYFDEAFEWIKKYRLNVTDLLAPFRKSGKDKKDGTERAGSFEFYIRTAYGYLLALRGAEAMGDADAETLPERDKFIYHAAKALEAKEKGDVYAYASGLRDALRFDMSLKEAVTAVLEELAGADSRTGTRNAEAVIPISNKTYTSQAPLRCRQRWPHGSRGFGASNLLEIAIKSESAALKAAIYGMIERGNLKEAARVLEQYAAINPTDPEILKILDIIQNNRSENNGPENNGPEVIFIINNISYTRNGIMNSVLQKARLMEERLGILPISSKVNTPNPRESRGFGACGMYVLSEMGIRPRVLIHGYNLELPRINLVLQNEKDGRRIRLPEGAYVESVYDYFQKTPRGGFEHAVLRERDKDARYEEVSPGVYDVYEGGAPVRREYYLAIADRLRLVEYRGDGVLEKGVYYDDWGNVSKIRFYGPDGERFTSEEFYDTGGRLRIRNVYGYQNGAPKQESVTVFGEDGEVLRECGDDIGLLALYLDITLGGDKTYIIVAEDGLSARAVAGVDKNNVIKAGVVHSGFLNDSYDLASSPQPYYKYICENREKFGAIVFLTEAERADFRQKFGKTSAALTVIPHPYPYPAVKTDFAERDNKKAVMVTRLDRVKRVDTAIEIFAMAAKEILDQIPDIKLEIYGSGPEEERCVELIKRLGLTGSVFIKGFTNDPPAVFSGAALSLLTSDGEGYGMTLVESVCNGCPAMAFDIKYGPADIIKDGETGFLVRRFDKKGYAAKLVSYFKDAERQKAMSENCYKDAGRFGADAYIDAWAELISTLCNRKNNI